MLNRIKKILIATVISASLVQPVLAANDSTISYIKVNDKAYQDIEIVISNGTEILVPFKQLADIFQIQYSANRADKKITFKTIDNKDGTITPDGVFVNGLPISKRTSVFIGQGIIEGVFNEAYIEPDVASKIMGVKLDTNFEELTLSADVSRSIPLIASLTNVKIDPNAPRAYQDVVAPKKAGKITLNKIGLRSQMMTDDMKMTGQGYSTSSTMFNGITQATLSGKLFDGKYRIEATESHYKNDAFMFSGVTATYANKIKDDKTGKDALWYELGKITGKRDSDLPIGQNVFGAQIWDYDYQKIAPKYINGYVKPTSLVRVTVNDTETTTLSTYAGYYTLKDVSFPQEVTKVKIEEVNQDGSLELIKEEKYSLFGDRPFENEQRNSSYVGVWGYQNKFFREGANIYKGQNKKVAMGSYYQYGVKDNVTFESKLTGDLIYEKSGSSVVYTVPTNDALLVSGTQKSVNYVDGATYLNSLEWVNPKNKNIKAKGIVGVSVARDARERDTHAGYIAKGVGEYEKDLTKFSKGIFKPKMFKAKAEIFQTSPDFYIASSDGTSKNDRTGGAVSGSFGINSTSASGRYSRYYSNMNDRYQGGTLKFEEITLGGATRIPKVAAFRFTSNYRRGINDLGRNVNYHYDANGSRTFGPRVNVQGGYRVNFYDTRFDEPNELNRNYRSNYTDAYAQVDYNIPKNMGRFSLGHNVVRYRTHQYKNNYNMFRFGYTFPTWKRLTLGLGYGFRYLGQGGNDYNVNLAYRAKSGQTMAVGYQYSENGGFFIDNMFTPNTNRHTVSFTFNDAFQVFHNGLKSVGFEDLDKGIFEAIAFVDVNKNGTFDRNVDIPVKDVPLITSWSGEKNYTNKRGRTYSSSLTNGVYTVTIDMDTLPITVAPASDEIIHKMIKIDGGQTTKLEIPLVSTVGTVSGVLKIDDEFDRGLQITDFIVVLLDDKGNEVNYSTVDYSGQFYISGLAPGKYTLKLDERFINAYGLEELPNLSEKSIMIPYDYNTPIDITDQNLEYKALSL